MRDPLIRAWLVLIAASLLATAASLSPLPGRLAMVAVLLLAWVKARVVLGAYLELDETPAIRRAFDLALAVFMILAGLSYLAA
ncbi:MAG: cytochrome C oxidase subunit IV family protein [Paracoccus sp. (in: a-proteobacteria)]|uniref:cytochrome C oxidase subunit IV family protein n=1 Tax=Paracoccus sp. TaxID=267 RepID=UPI0026E011DC|nr:cytochrome C oxidase subunit IV family protein [Paracoccus sp. (in: a-proteobacteria)]MDO5630317.1 cytochrome C oxidase subunit IV family protein [Paracoccus sp. (in: a-proteobacteria)]